MLTEQNYDSTESGATPNEPTAAGPAQAPLSLDERQHPIFNEYSQFLAPQYLAYFENIYPDDYPRTGLVTVTDESLAPRLRPGNIVMGVLIDPDDYETVTRIVAITTNDMPGQVIWGRVKLIDPDYVQLCQQAPDWEVIVKVRRAGITALVDVRYIVNADLV